MQRFLALVCGLIFLTGCASSPEEPTASSEKLHYTKDASLKIKWRTSIGDGSKGAYLRIDRKSTRLNSSHVRISYAVFCLKKKKKTKKKYQKKKLTIKKKMYEMCNVKLRRRVAEQKSHYIHAFEY